MSTTKKQDIKKLGILVDQVRTHCKAKNMQCLMFTEGNEDGTYAVSGYFGDGLVMSMVQHLMMWKPEIVVSAVQAMEEHMKQLEAQKEEEKPKLIIEP